MKNIVIPGKGAYYWNEFYFSEAYQSLPLKARDLLQCFLTELKKREAKIGKRKGWAVFNNGEISFTYSSFKKLTGAAKETYRRSLYALIERGIIEVTYRGGSGQGDRSKYKILALRSLKDEDQKWRSYTKESWKIDIKKFPNQKIGLKTRYKSGQSGRKSKTTLSNKALKSKNSPTRQDTKSDLVSDGAYTNVCA